jgi:CHAT domain-containing protein
MQSGSFKRPKSMRKTLLIFLLAQWAFPQSPASVMEQKIYTSVDVFVANPNEESLKKLEATEKTFYPKSKAELLAVVILNCNKAYYQSQFGQTQKAIKSYETAWHLFQKNKLSNYDITESCLKPLGNLYTIIGDYDNAENVIKQYYFIANAENDQPDKFASILNLSSVYYASGKYLEAIDLLKKTINSGNLTKTQEGLVWNNMGNNRLAIGNSGQAGMCYDISIDFLKKTAERKALANAYRNRAMIVNDLNSFQKAKELFLKEKGNSVRAVAKLYYDEAFIWYQNNKLAEAQNSINKVFKTLIPNYVKTALPTENSLYAETTLLDALDLQANLFLTKSQPQKALESYALSFHIEELFQSLLTYENSKIITQIRNRNRTEKCIGIYYSLYQKEKKISYIETAFLLCEHTKSAVLKQAISDSKTNSREEKLILGQLQNWNTTIVKEQQKLDLADISKINEAIKKQNELMLVLKSEQEKTNKTSDKALRITDLYSKLEKDKAMLVEYFWGGLNIYKFTLANKNIALELLLAQKPASQKLVEFIAVFSDAKTISDNPSAYNHLSNSAYRILRLPKKTSCKNLIVIPDGILNFLPFEALITQESATTNFAKMHYLLNDFKIGYNNSADFYLNSIPFHHAKEGILGVFPIFENSSLELAFSKKELTNLQAKFKGKFLDRQHATFENFKANASNYSILHLSTHASSGDISEPASIQFCDQKVLYSELYNLNINPDLVVLSACETGIGKLYKAEGAMSIARGFQFSGAQNLLFSLWKVNDFTTSVLMDKFYGNLKKGNSYFDSNHEAKLDFLADGSIPNTKKSPYYWASFVYYGTLDNQPKSNNLLWISLFGGLIALLLLWKLLLSKK